MKKILFCILFALILLPSTFARTEYYDLEDDEPEKIFGFTGGLRLSILGLEPVVGINFSNLEVEAGCSISTGLDGKEFGIAPSLSVGYCTNPFERGSCTTVGLEYYFMSPSYTHLLGSYFGSASNPGGFAGHAVSLYYKGAVHFTQNFGLIWRVRLPLFMCGNDEYYNITNIAGAGICCLTGITTVAFGVNFMF